MVLPKIGDTVLVSCKLAYTNLCSVVFQQFQLLFLAVAVINFYLHMLHTKKLRRRYVGKSVSNTPMSVTKQGSTWTDSSRHKYPRSVLRKCSSRGQPMSTLNQVLLNSEKFRRINLLEKSVSQHYLVNFLIPRGRVLS